jgi:hypothetical protein
MSKLRKHVGTTMSERTIWHDHGSNHSSNEASHEDLGTPYDHTDET